MAGDEGAASAASAQLQSKPELVVSMYPKTPCEVKGSFVVWLFINPNKQKNHRSLLLLFRNHQTYGFCFLDFSNTKHPSFFWPEKNEDRKKEKRKILF